MPCKLQKRGKSTSFSPLLCSIMEYSILSCSFQVFLNQALHSQIASSAAGEFCYYSATVEFNLSSVITAVGPANCGKSRTVVPWLYIGKCERCRPLCYLKKSPISFQFFHNNVRRDYGIVGVIFCPYSISKILIL